MEIALVTGNRRHRIFRLNANEAVLELLYSDQPETLSKLDAKISEVFPHAECDYLVMVADSTALDAFYTNAESLLWRDAGALMATLHLCATAYRLAFCPAGILGRELIQALFGVDTRVRALGAAAIGRLKAGRQACRSSRMCCHITASSSQAGVSISSARFTKRASNER